MTAEENAEVGAGSPGKLPDADGMPEYVRKCYEQGVSSDLDNRVNAVDDQMFAAGYQWNAKAERERLADDRPCLTIDRIGPAMRQVTGDVRLNKPGIVVTAAGGEASKQIADIYTGLIRNIEQQSDADTAYTGAHEASTACGMGFWRITTQYSDDDAFDLDIRIKRIADPFSVIFDPAAKEFDKSDARWCIVTWLMAKDEFEQQYPGKSTTGFESETTTLPGAGTSWISDWYTTDAIRVAELWIKRPVKRTLYLLSDGEVIGDDGVTPAMVDQYVREKNAAIVRDAEMGSPDEVPPQGLPLIKVERTREVNTHKVMQYIVSGADQLEEPTEWAGKYIPIIGVWGQETHIGDKVVRRGMVRSAKDAQRRYNYAASASVEVLALQPKSPYLVTPRMVVGEYFNWWMQAGKRNFPFLPYMPDPDAPGQRPERVQPPVAATGLMQEAAIAADDIKATTGIFDASLGQRSNETSGRAILARQREGDVGSYVYTDNLSKAIAYCGRQLVDLIPKIYDTERVVRVLAEDGKDDLVQINKGVWDPKTEKTVYLNDITVGEYAVVVKTGPAFSTRREEAAEKLTELVRSFPAAGPIVGDILVEQYDMPNGEKISNRLKKLLPPGIDDEGPAQPPQPDPAAQADAAKNAAAAEKTAAEAQGVKIDNATKILQLEAMLGNMQQQMGAMIQSGVMQALQQMFGGGGAQPMPGPEPQPGPQAGPRYPQSGTLSLQPPAPPAGLTPQEMGMGNAPSPFQ